MQVQLVRAWPHRFDAVTVEVDADACIGDALAQAGWQLDAEWVALSVFGVAAEASARLHDGDRIELLRALQLDPKQARRLRAGKAAGRRG